MSTETQSVITNLILNTFNFQLSVDQRFAATQRLTDGSFAGVNTLVPIVEPRVNYTPGKQLEISVADIGLTPDVEGRLFSEISSNLPYDLITEDLFNAV